MTAGLALAIAALGAVGSLARWALVTAAPASWRTPWATLGVNVVGALAIGVVVGLGSRGLDDRVRTALAVGLLGGFTTFSTFALDVVALVERRAWAVAAAYVVASVALACGACALGLALARR